MTIRILLFIANFGQLEQREVRALNKGKSLSISSCNDRT